MVTLSQSAALDKARVKLIQAAESRGVSFAVALRQRVEMRIAEAAIVGLIAAGYKLSVDNGEGDEDSERDFWNLSTDPADVLSRMFQTDEDYLFAWDANRKRGVVGAHFGWIKFVYGNDGIDVISDNTVNLEEAIADASALADQFERGGFDIVPLDIGDAKAKT